MGLQSRTVTIHECTCDGCGKLYSIVGESGLIHSSWREREWLTNWLDNDGIWKEHEGKWYCEDCVSVDDNDQTVYKSFAGGGS